MEFDQYVSSIELPNVNSITRDNTICLVSGWGNTQNAGESRDQLRGALVPIVNQKNCSDAYARYGGVTGRMICAGFEKGGKDGMQNDI